METFLDYLWMVLPALRIDMFLQRAKPKGTVLAAKTEEAAPIFALVNKKHGLQATATLIDDEFVVLEGSTARRKWASGWKSYAELHRELQTSGILAPQGEACVFTTSYGFSSPSAAAAVIHGRPANGRTDWHVENTPQTYSEWEAEKLAQEQPNDSR